MKNYDLFRLQEGVNQVSNIKGVKFAYALMKNKKLIEAEIKCLQESIQMTDQYKEFEKKRIELCEKFAEKDSNKKPIITNNNYVISDMTTFTAEVDTLSFLYKDEISLYQEKMKEYEDLLNEDSILDSTFFKIKVDVLPEEISANQLEAISELIEND